jgi:WD40 repeat protein
MNPAKAKSRAIFKHEGALYSLALDAKRGRLYAGSADYAIYSYDIPKFEPAPQEKADKKDDKKEPEKKDSPKADSTTSAPKHEPIARWAKHENYISALAFVERTGTLISGSYDGQLIWWDVAAGTAKQAGPGHNGWVRALRATPDEAQVVSVGDDMLVKVWDAASGKLVRTLEGHAKITPQNFVTALYALAISPDGKYAASGDRIGAVRVWEIATGKTVQQFDVPVLYTFDPRQRKRSIGGIRSLAFSPDGRRLAVGGIGQVGNVDGFEGPAHVELWDWQQPRKLLAAGVEGQKGIVNRLTFDPGGDWLIGGGGGNGGILAFWKVNPLAKQTSDETPPKDEKAAKDTKSKEKREPDVPVQRVKFEGHIHDFRLSADAGELYAAGHGKLEVWDLRG